MEISLSEAEELQRMYKEGDDAYLRTLALHAHYGDVACAIMYQTRIQSINAEKDRISRSLVN